MKALFDTSVLVAALLKQHPHHSLAFPRLLEVQRKEIEGHLTTHGMAELYATLTALPITPKLTPHETNRIIEHSVLSNFRLVPLTAKDYLDALKITADSGLSSGAIYDALHLCGARKAGCEKLYTLNLRHFRGIAPGDPLISSP